MESKERFEALAREHIGRDGVEDLLGWLGSTDFYTAPASTRYHGAHPGGLVEHSLEVHDWLLTFDRACGTGLSSESMAIVALFHDVCKVGCYKADTRNVKGDDGVWRKVPCYKFDEDFPFGGHGSKSMYLVQHFVRLEPEEAAAINCHMGQFDASPYSKPSDAYSAYPLAFLLHVADEAATHMSNK